jgi:phosphatidylinositol glycan class T
MEILPPILLPRWDTWTIVSTTTTSTATTTTTTKPLLTFQSDGTIVVEYNVTLNPMTTINITLDYEPALLPFQQFPADANRGIELPPTLFTFGNNNDASTCTNSSSITATTTLYSAPLLFMPPVPDMSMPFNVVSLTCTLYAFIVGSVANLLVRKASRRIQCRLLHPEEEHKSTLQRVKEKLLQCNLTRRFQKKRVHHGGGDAAVAIGNETEDKRNANVEHKEVSSTANEEESKMD